MAKFITNNHLGGYVNGIHPASYFPILWHYLVRKYNIQTVVDIGCGQGHAAKYFEHLGCNVLGIDGMEDPNRVLDNGNFVLHDYTTGSVFGPSWTKPNMEYDLCWSCEFVEHVSETYVNNFLQDFAKSKYVVMTHATPGQALRDNAHHHVNEQPAEYWIQKMQSIGYKYCTIDTLMLRAIADADAHTRLDGDYFNHFIHKGLMFKRH